MCIYVRVWYFIYYINLTTFAYPTVWIWLTGYWSRHVFGFKSQCQGTVHSPFCLHVLCAHIFFFPNSNWQLPVAVCKSRCTSGLRQRVCAPSKHMMVPLWPWTTSWHLRYSLPVGIWIIAKGSWIEMGNGDARIVIFFLSISTMSSNFQAPATHRFVSGTCKAIFVHTASGASKALLGEHPNWLAHYPWSRQVFSDVLSFTSWLISCFSFLFQPLSFCSIVRFLPVKKVYHIFGASDDGKIRAWNLEDSKYVASKYIYLYNTHVTVHREFSLSLSLSLSLCVCVCVSNIICGQKQSDLWCYECHPFVCIDSYSCWARTRASSVDWSFPLMDPCSTGKLWNYGTALNLKHKLGIYI